MFLKLFRGNTIDLCYESVFKSIQENRNLSSKHVIITPDRMAFTCEQQLFDTLSDKCFFDVEVVTLSRYSNKILDKRNVREKLLTKLGVLSIIKKILFENKKELSTFSKSCDKEGFVKVVFDTISMLKSCRITPDQIRVEDSPSSNLQRKMAEIKLIYSKYEEFLQTQYIDSFNRLNLFADNINKEDMENTYFYFVGYNDFTPQIHFIIQKMLQHSKGVGVTVCDGQVVNGKNFFNNQILPNLISIAEIVGCPHHIIQCANTFEESKKVLSETLFVNSSKFVKARATEDITVLKSNNIYDEVSFVAKQIRHMVVSGEYNYRNFSIIVSAIDKYKQVLKDTFADYDIPVFIDEGEKLSDNIVVRYLKDIFSFIFGNKPLQLLKIAKNPLSMLNHKEVNLWDNMVSERGIKNPAAVLTDVHINIRAFVSELLSLKKKVKTCKTVSEYVSLVKEVYEKLHIARGIEQLLAEFLHDKDIYQYKILVQIEKKFLEVLDEIDIVLKNYPCDNRFFVSLLDILDEVSVHLPPILSDTILVADCNSSFVRPNEIIFILGANEGAMPDYKEDVGIISDSEIDELSQEYRLSPTIRQVNAKMKYKVYENLLKYNNKMFISFYGEGREEALPAGFVKYILHLFGIKEIDVSLLQSSMLSQKYGNTDNNFIFNNVSSSAAKNSYVNMLNFYNRNHLDVNFSKYLNVLHDVVDRDNLYISNATKQKANKKIEGAEELFFGRGTTSVSQFESFYKCPFVHFINYGLKLQEKLDGKISTQDFGNIVHDFVEKIMPVLIAGKDKYIADISALEKISVSTINSVLENEYASFLDNSSNNFAIHSLRREVARISAALLQDLQLSKYLPEYFEKPFEMEQSLVSKGKKIVVRGIIDRVDFLKENKTFRVIDYKTGKEDFTNFTPLASGKKLQLFVYVKAVMEETGYTPVGAFYMPLSNSYFKEDESGYKLKGVLSSNLTDIINMDSTMENVGVESVLINAKRDEKGQLSASQTQISSEEISKLAQFAVDMMKSALQDMCGGEITPYPLNISKFDACAYCKYRGMCAFSEEDGDAKREVATVRSFAKLMEVEDAEIK